MRIKKLFAAFLCICMVLTLLPVSALAAGAAGNVGPTTIYDNANASGDGWSWVSSTKTLTLTNAAIRGADNACGDSCGIALLTDSTLELVGSSTVLAGTATGGNSCGVSCIGALTIEGTGNITAVGGSGDESYGIYTGVGKTLTFGSGFTGSVNAVGGKATGSGSYGVFCGGTFTLSGSGSVTATGGENLLGFSYGLRAQDATTISAGELTAVGGKAIGSSGISSGNITIIGTAAVTAVGGEATVTAEGGGTTVTAEGGGTINGSSHGIYASNGDITIYDSAVVNAVGGYAGIHSIGIYSFYGSTGGTVTISGTANVTATGGYANDYESCGIYAGKTGDDSLTISGGTVTATGGHAAVGYSAGIRSRGSAAISGSADVTATGGDSVSDSMGLYLNDMNGISLTVSGGRVTATGGYSSTSYGIYINTGSVSINSGEVTAVGGKADVSSYGVEASGSLEDYGIIRAVLNGRLTAVGGEAASSFGVSAENTFFATGTAQVTAVGGKATDYSTGLEAGNGVTVGASSGADTSVVTAVGGEVSGSGTSSGVSVSSAALNVSPNGALVAKGGDSGANSYGLDLTAGNAVSASGLLVAYAGKANAETGVGTAISGGSGYGTPLDGSNAGRYVVYGTEYDPSIALNGYKAYASQQENWPETPNNVIINTDGHYWYALSPNTEELNLKGLNVLIGGDTASGVSSGSSALCASDLNFTGTGTIIALGGTASTGDSCGIRADSLTKENKDDMISIIAIGGSSNANSYGVSASSLTQGANQYLTAIGGCAVGDSKGVSVNSTTNSDASVSDSISAVGGSSGSTSCGFDVSGVFTANSGAQVSAAGGASSSGSSIGICSGKNLTVNAAVSAIGGYASGDSIGVKANAGGDTASSGSAVAGTLSAVGGYSAESSSTSAYTSSSTSAGVYDAYGFTVETGGSVSSVGGSGKKSCGININHGSSANTSLAVNGTLFAVGGYSSAEFSAGAFTNKGAAIGGDAAYMSAVGGCAADQYKNCFGLHDINSDITLNANARAAFVGGKAARESSGVYCERSVTAESGSRFSAMGGSAGENSFGLLLDKEAAVSGVASAVGGSCGNDYSSIALSAYGTTVSGSLSAVGATTGAKLSSDSSVTGALSAVGGTDGIIVSGEDSASKNLSDSGVLHAIGGEGYGASLTGLTVYGADAKLMLSGGTKALDGTLTLTGHAKAKCSGSDPTGGGTLMKYSGQTSAKYIASGEGVTPPINISAPNSYTLTFNTNGGSEINTISRTASTMVELSEYTPTREGYTFTGWYSDPALTQPVTKVVLNGDTTVYAGWQADESKDEAWKNPFTDVSESDWFYSDIEYAVSRGLFKGVSDTAFGPHTPMTRAMLVTVLYMMEGEPTIMFVRAPDRVFSDVKDGAWYEKGVQWAQLNGIVEGYDNGTFRPDDPITREQLAAILYRFAQYKGYDVSVGENTNILSYTDAFGISEYAIPALQWACGAELIQGSDGKLMPQGNAERCQVAAMLHRFCENVK